ncbi:MAG TPA: hypothetical protein VMR48_02830 [Gaiellaceae bacterium]|nr:hypothetical protein [Gaiellaceae bacterium]
MARAGSPDRESLEGATVQGILLWNDHEADAMFSNGIEAAFPEDDATWKIVEFPVGSRIN